MVPTGEVQGGEVLGPHQCIQGLLDPGEWVGITKSWRYAPVGLSDCGIIAGWDAVLHCLSIPKIEVILGKTMGIQVQFLCDQIVCCFSSVQLWKTRK